MNELWEAFELPARDAKRLVVRQVAWTAAQTAAMGLLVFTGASPGLTLAIAMAVGATAAWPARTHLLPLVMAFVVAITLVLTTFGVPPVLAAGAAAGVAVGTGGGLARVEAVLAGFAGAGIGLWAADAMAPALGTVGIALWTGVVVGLCTSQALLPGALRLASSDRIPSPGRIQASLQPVYRGPCMRAWQLDKELAAQAPDRDTRRGLGEVAAWVYRLGQTLQTLDADLGRIDPDTIRARILALDAQPEEDSFIRERRAGTAQHLTRLLEHRDALARERARAASLQEYALAYLEEARAGLAVARVLPGEKPPESLGVVLERLRAHAIESGARRQTAREVERIK